PFSMRNIIAQKTGTQPDLAPVILAAHHDTVAWAPGTNDNGTGCAGVLEAAFALKDTTFERTIIFAFFAFEEDGLIGSEAYAASLAPHELPDSVIVLETIGFTSEKQNTVPVADVLLSMPVVGNFAGVFASTESRALLLDFLSAANRDVPGLPIYSIAVDDGMGSNPFLQDLLRSDHSPFWYRAVPALMITDTANLREGNVYHTADDDFAHVDLDFAMRVSKAAISTLCVRSGLIP
ncbi:MAG: M20/M25/M40 family metallo-hydrolase, partial [Spirochaetes bacterium]|nr:M20/M25/M40 family metallo-hydrolase [Spirochaetota bacterium]